MKNFVFHNPTKIIFGKDSLDSTGEETAQFGKRVMLVYGRTAVKNNGIYARVSRSLFDQGCTITEFCGVLPNPRLSMVHKAIELFRKNNCEVICAVGGGSVIDTGKAISCGVPVNHDVWKFFTAKKSITSTVPLVCVATLAGSGSENNSGMVITHDLKKHKFGYGSRHLFPKTAILDPETTYSASQYQTACGCVDIISHLVEFYCNNAISQAPLQFRMIEGLISAVMESCENALANPSDYNSRAQLMWASALALSGITSSGLGRVGFPIHLIEHSISALHDSPHGAGLAVVLPSWMKNEAAVRPDKIAQLGRRIFQIDGSHPQSLAEQTAEKFSVWFQKIGCPVSLEELNIKPEDHAEIAENTKFLAKIWRLREYSPEIVLNILNLCSK